MGRNRTSKPITASELVAQLEADPDWVRQDAARQAESDRLGNERLQALRPVTDELQAAGFDVQSPWDLHRHAPYSRAVPILLAHLKDASYDEEARFALATALAVPEARGAWRDLVDLYRQVDPNQYQLKGALAAAISVIAERSVADELIELLFDVDIGSSRVLLLGALTRLRLPNAWPLIADALSDADLRKEADHMLHERALRTQRKQRRG